jgi:hypothetical protein
VILGILFLPDGREAIQEAGDMIIEAGKKR